MLSPLRRSLSGTSQSFDAYPEHWPLVQYAWGQFSLTASTVTPSPPL